MSYLGARSVAIDGTLPVLRSQWEDEEDESWEDDDDEWEEFEEEFEDEEAPRPRRPAEDDE